MTATSRAAGKRCYRYRARAAASRDRLRPLTGTSPGAGQEVDKKRPARVSSRGGRRPPRQSPSVVGAMRLREIASSRSRAPRNDCVGVERYFDLDPVDGGLVEPEADVPCRATILSLIWS